MNKNVLIIVVAVLILAVIGVIYFMTSRGEPAPVTEETVEALTESVEDATLDLNVPTANPLDEIIPDVNPVEKANPFDDIYTNPFE